MKRIHNFEDIRAANDAKRMFIDEQTSHLDLRADFWLEMLRAIVWSPTINQHPFCKTKPFPPKMSQEP